MIKNASIGEKLQLMRKAEGLSRREMGEITGVSSSNIRNYESLGRQIPAETLIVILSLDRFRKYTEWLMFNQTNPATGQIAPALSPDGCESSEGDQGSTQVTQKSHR